MTGGDPTGDVFRFLSRATGLVGLLSIPFAFTAAPGERSTVVAYSSITLALAASLALVRGRNAGKGAAAAARPTR